MMTRSDFDTFLSVSGHLPNSITLFAAGIDFFKVMDKYSIISKDGKRGVAVDIFVMDDRKTELSFINVHTQTRLKYSKDRIFPLLMHKFGYLTLPVPNDHCQILTDLYGDYMILPPLEKRVSPHINSNSVKIFEFPRKH